MTLEQLKQKLDEAKQALVRDLGAVSGVTVHEVFEGVYSAIEAGIVEAKNAAKLLDDDVKALDAKIAEVLSPLVAKVDRLERTLTDPTAAAEIVKERAELLAAGKTSEAPRGS